MTIDEMPATSACLWEMEAINGQEHVSPVNSSISAQALDAETRRSERIMQHVLGPRPPIFGHCQGSTVLWGDEVGPS